MRRYVFISAVNIVMVFIAIGCTNSSKSNEDEIEVPDHLFQITQKQFESDSMKIGEVTTQHFEDVVTCNGYIAALPNGMAQISARISGIVETIHCSLGNYVKKGQILCTLSSNELLVLQQDFAETSVKLKRLKADYQRKEVLYNEKIGAEKDFVAIESEHKTMMIKYHSLKLRLELLKLNVSKIEAGELYSAFPIIAPINGYITSQNIVLGQFTEQSKNLVEIVDINQLQLQLSVFENDIRKLKIGQNIQFNSLGVSNAIHYATLSSIGKTINPESKTIQCIAKIKNEEEVNFINRSYIEAMIISNQREAKALPNEAILKSGKDYYVFVVKKSDSLNLSLRKVKVKTGSISKRFSEIIDGGDLTKVITNGVYNLQTE